MGEVLGGPAQAAPEPPVALSVFVKIDEVVGQTATSAPNQIWLRAGAPQNGGVDSGSLSQGAPLFVVCMADEAQPRAAEQLASAAKSAPFVLADGDQTLCDAVRVSFGG